MCPFKWRQIGQPILDWAWLWFQSNFVKPGQNLVKSIHPQDTAMDWRVLGLHVPLQMTTNRSTNSRLSSVMVLVKLGQTRPNLVKSIHPRDTAMDWRVLVCLGDLSRFSSRLGCLVLSVKYPKSPEGQNKVMISPYHEPQPKKCRLLTTHMPPPRFFCMTQTILPPTQIIFEQLSKDYWLEIATQYLGNRRYFLLLSVLSLTNTSSSILFFPGHFWNPIFLPLNPSQVHFHFWRLSTSTEPNKLTPLIISHCPTREREGLKNQNGRDCETARRVRNHATQSFGMHSASDLRSVGANLSAVPLLLRRSAQPPRLVPLGSH